MRPVRDLLAELFQHQPALARRLKQHRLWEVWAAVAGPRIAAVANPVRMQETTLVIGVATAAWMQELVYLKPELLEKLQAAVGPALITDIRLALHQYGVRSTE